MFNAEPWVTGAAEWTVNTGTSLTGETWIARERVRAVPKLPIISVTVYPRVRLVPLSAGSVPSWVNVIRLLSMSSWVNVSVATRVVPLFVIVTWSGIVPNV